MKKSKIFLLLSLALLFGVGIGAYLMEGHNVNSMTVISNKNTKSVVARTQVFNALKQKPATGATGSVIFEIDLNNIEEMN